MAEITVSSVPKISVEIKDDDDDDFYPVVYQVLISTTDWESEDEFQYTMNLPSSIGSIDFYSSEVDGLIELLKAVKKWQKANTKRSK